MAASPSFKRAAAAGCSAPFVFAPPRRSSGRCAPRPRRWRAPVATAPACASLFFACGRWSTCAASASRAGDRGSAVVLAYHAIADVSEDRVLAPSVPPRLFAEQLDALAAAAGPSSTWTRSWRRSRASGPCRRGPSW